MISITIIFNENELNLPVTHLESNDPFHKNLILRICDAYEINIDKENYIDDLLKDNHIIMTTTQNVLLCYIPNNITENQYESLQNLKEYMNHFKGFYGIIMLEQPLNFFKEDDEISLTIDQFLEYISEFCISKTR